ncbi:hypothetical protein EWM62_07955 [Mucilaginibacter terrigena]|uniref:Uncharacterized protein n=1 Tax=Mucilaginibacter terrigena TaxID=2492395 RepID=A0A4Q5LLP6_9SPHI|nr:hypothetical protein [Mucilaginibacter terrigena]RYU90578.1 hypothetical protein EWM62_07955 [Mucilaginibacter terrigena]
MIISKLKIPVFGIVLFTCVLLTTKVNSSACEQQAVIEQKQIQGLWKAFKDEFRFDGTENTMNLFIPMIIEVKDSLLRRSNKNEFMGYQLKENMILWSRSGKIDTGIINKITKKEFTITWIDKANFTRYYYKK